MTVANGRAVPALLRHLNGRAVLAALQRHGPLSRAEIVRQTGVSGPTVTRVVAGLLSTGALSLREPARTALGGHRMGIVCQSTHL